MNQPPESRSVQGVARRPLRRWSALRSLPAARRGGVREIALLAFPVILTQISMTTMGLVDSAMVGSLGATELAAVGFGGIWLWTSICFLMGSTSAVQTFVSQDHGAGQPHACGAWAWQGIYAVVPLGAAVMLALLWFADPLMRLLGPSPELQPVASDYIRGRSLGIVGLTMATALASFFRGIGDTKTPLYATLGANIVHVVLDYGLIFGELGLPRWGVAGAGIATAISEWVFLVALLVPFLRRRTRDQYATTRLAPVGVDVRRLLRTGSPIGGQWWLETMSFAVFMTIVARMGDASMAASQAFIALLSLSFMQAIGIGIGVATLVGRYIGASEPVLAARSFRSGLVLSTLLAGLVVLLFSSVPEMLIRIFSDDPEVIALGRPLLIVGALFQFCDSFGIVADGALRGAGDTRWPFLIRLGLAWGVFVPLAWWVGVVLSGGLTFAWAAAAVHVALLSGALVWRFQHGAWKEIAI